MKKAMAFATAAALAWAAGAGQKAAQIAHVPERLDSVRPISPAAAKANHIAVVNVGNAMAPDDWARAVTYASSRLQVNVWTNGLAESVVPAALDDPSAVARALGPKAKVAVFVEDSAKAVPFLSVPGAWCRVNVRWLKADNPSAQTLRDRYAKAVLKGFVYACGSGAALDARSASNYDTLTLAGVDKTGITVSPDSYFPMLEVLRIVGGEEILSPAVETSYE